MFDSLRNYGVRNRVKNMVWNISENYDVNVNVSGANSFTDTTNVNVSDIDVLMQAGVSEEDAINQSLYAAAHEGAHVKLSKTAPLIEYMKEGIKKGANKDILNGIMQVTEDYRVDWSITKKRPGYNDLREKSMKTFVSLFGKSRSGNYEQDLTKAISAWTYGTDMRKFDKPEYKNKWADLDWTTIENIGNSIMKEAKKAKSSADSAKISDKLYAEHFGYTTSNNAGQGQSGNNQDGNKSSSTGGNDADETETNESKSNSDKSNNSDSTNAENESNGNSGESENNTDIEDLVKNSMDTMGNMLDSEGRQNIATSNTAVNIKKSTLRNVGDSLRNIKINYEVTYGKCLWSKEEWENIEREICRGVHAGTSLLYVKAVLKSYNVIDYNVRHRVIKDNNLDGKAKILANKLQEDMRAAKDSDGYVSDNGGIIANRAYRATKTNDNHVFFKKSYNDVGGYVVDLLLDASGSQDSREESIRQQAYVIARACSIAGIPCRVTSFQWTGEVDVLQLFRDYDDPKEKDEEVFKYKSDHSNRDGLSILATAYTLKQRLEDNKILIVLSDGSPAGSCSRARDVGGMIPYSNSKHNWNGAQYSGVDDVANVVRNIRKTGIALMGIYVGGTHALEDEKTMYGNDFAYITTMDTFVPKVTEYLKKQILKFQ